MTKQKKFITCDGNEAAAHISYMFSEVAAIYPGLPQAARTSSARQSWYRKCNLKPVLPVPFTVPCKPVR